MRMRCTNQVSGRAETRRMSHSLKASKISLELVSETGIFWLLKSVSCRAAILTAADTTVESSISAIEAKIFYPQKTSMCALDERCSGV